MRIGPLILFERAGEVEDRTGGAGDFNGIELKGGLWEVMSAVRQVAKSREDKIKAYDKMAKDSTINSALEMMSEDATQYDQAHGHIVWITSDNDDVQKELMKFLHEEQNIDSRLFPWIYRLAKHGELFLRTFDTDRTKGNSKRKTLKELTEKQGIDPEEQDSVIEQVIAKLPEAEQEQVLLSRSDEFYEEVEDSSTVFHLIRFGKTSGYFVKNSDGGGTIFPAREFIHLCSDTSLNRTTIKIPVKDPNDESKTVDRVFKVKFGSSILEGAMQAFNIVQTLEDVMVASRMSRSSLFRIYQVNVGSANKQETVRILREVKNAVKQKERIDQTAGTYKSDASALPVNDSIFVPSRNGKGDISIQTVGGDIDVRSIVDFDFFWNKLCGALRVPKAFLGFEDSLPGGIGNTSLTRMDIRYARTIKRLVTTLRQGIKDLCDYHLYLIGKEELIGQYNIHFTPINDAEESDRVKDIADKADAAMSMVNILSQLEGVLEGIEITDLVVYIFKHILGVDLRDIDPNLSMLKKKPEPDDAGDDEDYEDEPEEDDNDGALPRSKPAAKPALRAVVSSRARQTEHRGGTAETADKQLANRTA